MVSTSALPSTARLFPLSASVLSPLVFTSPPGTVAAENSTPTKSTTATRTGLIRTEAGKSGLSTSSTSQSSTPSRASTSVPRAFASTDATHIPTPALSRFTNTLSEASTTTSRQERSTSSSSVFLASESLASSSPVSIASLSLPTEISDPDLDSTHETHELVVDLGNCGDIAAPTVIDDEGNRLELASLGGGRYMTAIGKRIYANAGHLAVSLTDNGGRCGQHAECPTVFIYPGDNSAGIRMFISNIGHRANTMYPLSIWMDGAVTWDDRPAHSSETASHCWGWTEDECPNSQNGIHLPLWTISSESPTARAFVTFCPPNGPDLSSVGPNPNPPVGGPRTWALSPTTITVPVSTFISAYTIDAGATPGVAKPAGFRPKTDPELPPGCSFISACSARSTYIPKNQVSTITPVFLGPPGTAPPALTTYISLDVATTVFLPTFATEPTSPVLTSWIVRNTDPIRSTVQSEWTFATLSPGPMRSRMTEPVLATVTDSAGSAVVTTIQPSSTHSTRDTLVDGLVANSSPSRGYIMTSWTTWMEVNGSTVPAIAGQVAIETTALVTYALESGTIIPVGALSSLSIESMRTALPSATSAEARAELSASKRGKIAGALVGTIVGLALGSVLIWFICRKRRKTRSGDYLAQGSLGWGGSREGGLLDLDGAVRERDADREMVVEPWAPPVSVARRKVLEHRNMCSGRDAEVVEYDSSQAPESGLAESGSAPLQPHYQPSGEQHMPTAGVRTRKLTSQGPSQSRLWSQQQHLSSPLRSQGSELCRPDQMRSHNPPIANSPNLLLSTSAEAGPHASALAPRIESVEQQNTIPPLYNEAWRAI